MDTLVRLKVELENVFRTTDFKNYKLMYSIRPNAVDVHVENFRHQKAHGQIVFSDAYLNFYENNLNTDEVKITLLNDVNFYVDNLHLALHHVAQGNHGLRDATVPSILIERKTVGC